MALVMLPCDLPWWDSVKKLLHNISTTKNTLELIEGMQKIYEICNISLDPEEELNDPQQFIGFLNFLDNDLTLEERSNFLNKTLPTLCQKALSIKDFKPKGGLHFSLQQQSDSTELDYEFVAALLANSFFSTFPKRTDKSHPTLQNFNFAEFFKHLSSNVQKAKLRSIFHYFDWLNSENSSGKIKILRQVMTNKEWLTIEDWLECNLPLCPLQIKHEGKLEKSDPDALHICFSSSKLGGKVLENGFNQESLKFSTTPELLTVLLQVEALEDNEVLTIENCRVVSRIQDPKNRANFEKLQEAQTITVCCSDADDYRKLPIGQYEEDNILRELNKSLLAFQQKTTKNEPIKATYTHRQRRLSPIGESLGSNLSDSNIPLITQQSCSTTRSGSKSPFVPINENNLMVDGFREKKIQLEGLVHNRRGRFIVLGSSGECLPVSRKPLVSSRSVYSSCDSSDEEFLSARTSLEDSEDENYHKRYSVDLETPERRHTFAERLKDALRRELSSSSEESSYAVGISVTGGEVSDKNIKVKRGGSTGFTLEEDDSLPQNYTKTLPAKKLSSEYSFTTEYSSELEEVYEQFSKWLENPILETEKGTFKRELDARDLAIVKFAGSILKRTLSESFAGIQVPLTESCDSATGSLEDYPSKKNRLVLNAKSLSLELARQKHKLAAQLSVPETAPSFPSESNLLDCKQTSRKAWFISCVNEDVVQTLEDVSVSVVLPARAKINQIAKKPSNGLRPISTGNWGCGTSRKGDVQLKVILQWLAASVAGAPQIIYYTQNHPQLAKLDTVLRILIDRKWTVKDLAQATLRYSTQVLHGKELSGTLFEELIERTIQ